MDIGWTMFWEGKYLEAFHESFFEKISTQLETEIGKITGIKEFHKYGFQLIYGMDDIHLRFERNKAFSIIKLITPTSWSIPVTIYWTSDEIENIKDAHKMDVSEKEIEINWGVDFPIETIQSFCKPYKIKKKEKTGYSFDVEYYYYSLQDVYLTLEVEKPIKPLVLEQMNQFLGDFRDAWNKKHKNKFIKYISKATLTEQQTYHIATDLAGENTIRTISKLIKSISESFPNIGLTKIIIK